MIERKQGQERIGKMESYVLDDVEYDFKPLEIFVPDPDYKVDEKELKKSMAWIRHNSEQDSSGKQW